MQFDSELLNPADARRSETPQNAALLFSFQCALTGLSIFRWDRAAHVDRASQGCLPHYGCSSALCLVMLVSGTNLEQIWGSERDNL